MLELNGLGGALASPAGGTGSTHFRHFRFTSRERAGCKSIGPISLAQWKD